jgi:DNA-binding GntR family transcriptional regulator
MSRVVAVLADRSLTAAVYKRLRADILSCRLKPSEKLKVSELAASFEVSLGAVREALARLSSEGLVVAEAQRGFQVAPVSEADLLDLTNVRIEIETTAVRQAIAKGDLNWESRIVAAYHRLANTPLRQPDDEARLSDAWSLAHEEFNSSLAAACGSPRLLNLRTMFSEQAERYRRFSVPLDDHDRNIQAEHKRMMEAVLARDADLAAQLIANHVRATTEILLEASVAGRLAVGD